MARKYFILNFEQFNKYVTINKNAENYSKRYLLDFKDGYFIKTTCVKVSRANVLTTDKVIYIDDNNIHSYVQTLIIADESKTDGDRLRVHLYDTINEARREYYKDKESEEPKYKYFVLFKNQRDYFLTRIDEPGYTYKFEYKKLFDKDSFEVKLPNWYITIKDDYTLIKLNQFMVNNLESRVNLWLKYRVQQDLIAVKFHTVRLFDTYEEADEFAEKEIKFNYDYQSGFVYSNQVVEHKDTNGLIPHNLGSIKLNNSGCGSVYFQNYKYDPKVHEKIFDSMLDRTRYMAEFLGKKETDMTIKDVKFNPPATIVFWSDGTKTVVKCQANDKFDAEKGLAMAISKKFLTTTRSKSKWYDTFKKFIPEKDPKHYSVKIERKIDHYDKKGFENETTVTVKELPIDYKKLCANVPESTTVKIISETKDTKISDSPLVDKINQDYILEMFNAGATVHKISKETGLSEYYVKKYIDIATNPDYGKNKAARILNNIASKKNKPEKKERKKHVIRTQIDYPDYLDKETCDRVLARTKEKYKDHPKIQYLSELQKYFIMECKREYIITHYGNGYDMYAIAKVIGINAASVQRIWNACKSGKD